MRYSASVMLGMSFTRNRAGEKIIETGAKTRFRAGQASPGDNLINVMLVIVIAAAVGFVGTDVTAEINDSIDTDAGTDFGNAQDNLSSGYADAMGLSDIVFIVLMFSVILGALLVFRVRT